MRQHLSPLSPLSLASIALLFGTLVSRGEESFSYSVQNNGEFLLQIQHAEATPKNYRIELQELRSQNQTATISGFSVTKLPGILALKWKPTVPQGVYLARLFRGPREIPLVHDDVRLPDTYSTDHVKVDRRENRIRWRAPRASVARVNAVLTNGMCIDTVAPWHFTSNTEQAIEWSFSDRGKVRNYRDNPALQIYVQYVPLPDYLVIIGRPAFSAYEALPIFLELPLPTGDQEVALEAISNGQRTVAELPGIPLPVVKVGGGLRVKLDPTTKANIGKRRYEIMIYADGEFIYEEPEGADPYTFLMPALPRKSGLVYLSVNILDYNGNAGSHTLPVWFESNLK
jgi:hypothetical protein